MSELNTMMTDINAKLDALGNNTVSRSDVEGLVTEHLSGLANNEEFRRKMRFGNNADPRLMGSKFSRYGLSQSDIEFMYDLMRGAQVSRVNGANGDPHTGPSEELTNAFKHISEANYIPEERIKEIDREALDGLFPRIPLRELSQADQALYGPNARHAGDGPFQNTEIYKRAMDTAESGYGSQLIGAEYVSDLWTAARNQSRVMNTIRTHEMTAPTAFIPVEADIPEMLFVPESTASNSSNYATSKTGSQRVQLDAKKFVIHQMWSSEMEEDSIIPFIPFLRGQVMLSLAHYGDSLVINADTTNAATGNINLDDADPADTKHYLAFDGLLHAALIDNANALDDLAGAAITYNDLTRVPGRMVDTTYLHDWGHPTRPEDLIYVADPETGDRIAQLSEMVNWKIQQGRVLLGQPGVIGDIMSHPVISSIALSKAEADGRVSATPANNTLGRVLIYNRRAAVLGWRRRVKMAVEQIPATDQVRMVHSLRLGFGRFSPTGAASGIQAVRALYNISLA